MISIRKRAGLALLLASAMVAAGCGGTEDEAAPPADADPELVKIYDTYVRDQLPGVPISVLQGAKAEGKVVWYHLRLPEATRAAVEEFKKRFPFIEVEEFEDSGGSLFERFISEQRAGVREVDVWMGSQPEQVIQASQEGYVREYKVSGEDTFADQSYESGLWYAYGRTNQAVYLYNTNLVSPEQAELLKDYDGLWDPALDGLATNVFDPADGTAGRLYFYYLEKEYGKESWDALAAKRPKIVGSTASADLVGSGEAAVAPMSEGVALRLWARGAPVRWTVPEPVLVTYYPQALAAESPNPNAAILLHEFILSQDGQKISGRLAEPSARTDVGELREVASEDWFVPVDKREQADLDREEVESNATRIVDEWKSAFVG